MALAIILFEGCDKKGPDPTHPLVGTWIFKSYVDANCTDPLDNDSGTCSADCEKLIFKSDKTGTIDYVDPTDTDENFTYTITNNKISVCFNTTNCEELTFTISGSTLSLSYDDPDLGCKSTVTYQKQ